ncbi:hypothetical protein SBA3_980001 [Candidatus Sulfopaludibacter sp. SbA3]|nr:hypothetical protein SBA3_980001 [Candidatus Sulfopaludibacter sp. SbA3]
MGEEGPGAGDGCASRVFLLKINEIYLKSASGRLAEGLLGGLETLPGLGEAEVESCAAGDFGV